MGAYDAGQLRMDINVTGLPQAQAAMRTVDSEARKAATGLEKMGGAVDGTMSMLSQFKGLLLAWGVKEAVLEVKDMADAWTSMTGKLKLVTASGAELAAVQGQLLKIAQDSRQDLDSVVTLYARMARATEGAKVNQGDLITVTRSLSQALALSGATSQEAKNAIVQLSQGMALGTLRGQDLKSVLEETPAIGQQIAKGMGVSFGQLRKLSEEGKITNDAIIRAMLKQSSTIEKEFKKLPPTVAQATTQVANSFTAMIGRIDRQLGSSRFFARLLEFGARGLDKASAVIEHGTYIGDLTEARDLSNKDLQARIDALSGGAAGKKGIRSAVATPLGVFGVNIGGAAEGATERELAALLREQNRRRTREAIVIRPDLTQPALAATAKGGVSYSTSVPAYGLGTPYDSTYTMATGGGATTTIDLPGQGMPQPRESTMGPAIEALTKEFNERMAAFQEEVQNRAQAVSSLIGNSLASGITEAVRSGDIGAGLEALGKSFLGGLGGLLQQMGEKLLLANQLLIKALTFTDPFGGLAAAIGLIALGGALQGLASRGSPGSVPVGAGAGASASPGTGTVIDRGTIAASLRIPAGDLSGSRAATQGIESGLTVLQPVIIGPDDVAAQAQIARLVANAARRGYRVA